MLFVVTDLRADLAVGLAHHSAVPTVNHNPCLLKHLRGCHDDGRGVAGAFDGFDFPFNINLVVLESRFERRQQLRTTFVILLSEHESCAPVFVENCVAYMAPSGAKQSVHSFASAVFSDA